MRKKHDLPQKICLSCGLPFSWRKKWERDWEQVRYCSKRCSGAGPRAGAEAADAPWLQGRRR
ncbi:MAG: DUF2256 domain-containing protein [Burkholderiaceae bacterium]|nr:DUF2256 domain-containing protein [Burkholderiaceae bacterium]